MSRNRKAWMVIGVLALAAATAVAQDKRGGAPRDAEPESAAAARLERSIGRLERSIEQLESAISRLEARSSDRRGSMGGGMMGEGGMMGGSGMMDGGGMMGGSRPNEQWRSPQGGQ